MADVHTKETRSFNMSQIHSRDTGPEVLVRKHLFAHGFRYRKNDARLPGTPDIVLPKYKTCIFVNGCFWHMHEGCRFFVWPKSNVEFWRAKIIRNAERDRRVQASLTDDGWKVIVVWACELRKGNSEYRLDMLCHEIREVEDCAIQSFTNQQ